MHSYRREGPVWVPSPYTAGPWSPDLQHAGPVSALLCRVATEARGDAWRVGRVTVEMLRPAPVAPLRVVVEHTQEGRQVTRVTTAALDARDRVCFRALVLLVKMSDPIPVRSHGFVLDGVLPEDATPWTLPDQTYLDYRDSVEIRVSHGTWAETPVLGWFRMRGPLVDGTPTQGIERVLHAADAASGLAPALDWKQYSYPNAELTVHLLRDPVDAWVGLYARTDIQPGGLGLTTAAIVDRQGLIGRSSQVLVVKELRRS
jgi:hypothetical protein